MHWARHVKAALCILHMPRMAEGFRRTVVMTGLLIGLANLCYKLHGSASLLDLALCKLGDKFGLHEEGLLGQLTLAEHLEDAVLGHINYRCAGGVLGCVQPCLPDRTSSEKHKFGSNNEITLQLIWHGMYPSFWVGTNGQRQGATHSIAVCMSTWKLAQFFDSAWHVWPEVRRDKELG